MLSEKPRRPMPVRTRATAISLRTPPEPITTTGAPRSFCTLKPVMNCCRRVTGNGRSAGRGVFLCFDFIEMEGVFGKFIDAVSGYGDAERPADAEEVDMRVPGHNEPDGGRSSALQPTQALD